MIWQALSMISWDQWLAWALLCLFAWSYIREAKKRRDRR